MIGKLVAAAFYSILFTAYLEYFDAVELVEPEAARALGSTFRTLTYRQKYELLQARSSRDPLTELYNRGFFDETLKSQIATAIRANAPLALLMADIDHFKLVNDTRGHLEGDHVLQVVAKCLAAGFRSSDYVCRYGGEEFVVLLPNTDLPNATMLAEKTRRRIEALCDEGELDMKLTVTIGAAVYPAEASAPDELLRLVDQRLYDGKHAGRNRVVAGVLV
jgi:diguanylate cyclase (GGDEF)-like protein